MFMKNILALKKINEQRNLLDYRANKLRQDLKKDHPQELAKIYAGTVGANEISKLTLEILHLRK